VSHNSGEQEWNTPVKYIEMAKEVMGGIDLDPASNGDANIGGRARAIQTRPSTHALEMDSAKPMDTEEIFTVTLSESALTLVVGALWGLERHQIRLAQQASNGGNTRHATARRATAAKALTLADRLVAIGGGQWVMPTELDTNWDLLFTAVTAAVFAGILIGLAVAILVIRTERNWARKRKALRGPKKPDKPWAMQWYFCL
jgi:hypothetical protein